MPARISTAAVAVLLFIPVAVTAQVPVEVATATDREIVRQVSVTGTVTSVDGSEEALCRPGGRATLVIDLARPVALEAGMRFAVREGGRTVGAGRVLEVV